MNLEELFHWKEIVIQKLRNVEYSGNGSHIHKVRTIISGINIYSIMLEERDYASEEQRNDWIGKLEKKTKIGEEFLSSLIKG